MEDTAVGNKIRAHSDHSAVMRAAEIVADKLRVRDVIRLHDKQKAAVQTMEQMLTVHRKRAAAAKSRSEVKDGTAKIRRGAGPVDVTDHGSPNRGVQGISQISYVED